MKFYIGVVLGCLALASSLRAETIKLTLDTERVNPVHGAGVPGDAGVPAAKKLGGCSTVGYVADEPLFEVTVKEPVTRLEVEASAPWTIVFSNGTTVCGPANNPTLIAGSIAAGGFKLYAIGHDSDGAGPSEAYRRGDRVNVRLEGLDAPRRYVLDGVPVQTVKAEPVEPLLLGGVRPTEGVESIPNCGVFGDRPSQVLESKAPIRAASFTRGFATEEHTVRIVGPLDASRAQQQVLCLSPQAALANDDFLEGRYAIFPAVARKPSHFTVLLSGPKTKVSATFRSSRPEDLSDLPIAWRALPLHFSFFPAAAYQPSRPEEIDQLRALWHAVPKQLLVSPKVALDDSILPDLGAVIPVGEPLLVVSGGDRDATVLTVDGREVTVSQKFLLPTVPSRPVLPTQRRWKLSLSEDDDANFDFVSKALQPAYDRFKSGDTKAQDCWQKHYNPEGAGYDVVTYRNGRIVNVESLDERFRNSATRACKRLLDAAAKGRADLLKKLFAERTAQYERLFSDARIAATAACSGP